MPRDSASPKGVHQSIARIRRTGVPFDLVSRFVDHVIARRNPHEFPGVVLTKPPGDADFIWLSDEITLPSAQVMVCCAWCSNGHPKFRRGRLLWFPDEGVLRFVGHRCARSHLSAEKMALADNEWREKKRRSARDAFLRDNCPAVEANLLVLNQLILIGNACDQYHAKFVALPAGIFSELATYVRNGELFVEDQRPATGVARPRIILGILDGLQVFEKKPNLKGSLEFSRRQLLDIQQDAHRARGGNLTHMCEKRRDVVQALLKQAFGRISHSALKIESFQAFLRPQNIALLNAWCCHETSDVARCGIEIRQEGRQKLLFKYRERGAVGLAQLEAFPVMLRAMPQFHSLRWSRPD